jgi:hypothetical protein
MIRSAGSNIPAPEQARLQFEIRVDRDQQTIEVVELRRESLLDRFYA